MKIKLKVAKLMKYPLASVVLLLFVSRANAQVQDTILTAYNNQAEITAKRSVTLKDGFYVPSGKTAWVHIAGLSFEKCTKLLSLPSVNQNFVSTKIFKNPGILKDEDTRSTDLTNCDVSQTIQYLDGLGRPIQTVSIQGSPGLRDLVQPTVYDALGRRSKQYLPYSASLATSNGSFKTNALADQASFYTNPSSFSAPNVTVVQNAYSELHFEALPFNRVDESGEAGNLWKLGSGHTQKRSYRSNNTTINYSVDGFAARLYKANSAAGSPVTTLAGTGYYGANQLRLTIGKDENWITTDGKAGTEEVYKNKDEQKVLVRKFNKTASGAIQVISTYYVYDDYGNLSFVLSPGADPDAISVPSQTTLDSYCYQYRYDDRNRLIERKMPGKGWEYIVYNDLDQPVAVQDAVQRTKAPQEWQVIKYDVLGRAIIAGTYTYPSSVANTSYRAALQTTVDAQTIFWETRSAGADYTSSAFPQSGMDARIVNYYDDYNFPGGNTYTYAGASTKTKGLQTGSKVKVIGTSTMLLGEVYYDDEGRPLKIFKQHYLGGTQGALNYDEILYTYNFIHQITNSTRVHHAGATATTIANRYTYDHMGRRISTIEAINGAAEVVLSKLEYNEIGQLMEKSLHSTDGTSFTQNSTYAYNERGWLSKINDPNTTPAADKIFSMELVYGNKADAYNGNIGTMNWKTKVPVGLGLTEQLQSYTYDYDKLNRLNKAAYTATGAVNKFNEELSYDVMGNITGLKRANNTSGYLNNFTYNYGAGSTAGHRLLGVTDSGTAAQSSNYTYDENGNQKTDSRKGLTTAYNLMNLPQTITKTSTGESLNYVYDATGQKLRKISGANTKDYIGGIEYNNGVVESIRTEEGRALPGSTYIYEYMLRDHLGNTRAAFKQNGDVIQVQDYYAFGLEMNPGNRVTPSPNNLYTYNGKEKQGELALDQLDYGARYYDPLLGRWSVPDPMAENHHSISPYNYVLNNPMSYIDPLGLDTIRSGTSTGKARPGDLIQMDDGSYRVFSYEVNIVYDKSSGTYLPMWAGSDFNPYTDMGHARDNQGGAQQSNFVGDNWKDIGFLANDLTQSFINRNTTLAISEGYNLAKSTVFLPLGLATRTSTGALSALSKTGGLLAKAAPWVAAGSIGINIAVNKQVTAGDIYQSVVTGASLVPGWGLIIGGGALALEGASYYFTGKSVSDNINANLNGGVIYSWK